MDLSAIATAFGGFFSDASRRMAVLFLLVAVLLWTSPVQAALGLRLAPLAWLPFVWRKQRRRGKKRRVATAALPVIFCGILAAFPVDFGAEAGLGSLFLFPVVSAVPAMSCGTLRLDEKAALGAPALAAALLALTLFCSAGKLNFIDLAALFGAAAAATALTLALRPKIERNEI
ncbi:MAG: hypothetical protein MJ016_00980 [Victivallaceae bacterium]|nr:hypothetical protein [Victivallaceae bacterium]